MERKKKPDNLEAADDDSETLSNAYWSGGNACVSMVTLDVKEVDIGKRLRVFRNEREGVFTCSHSSPI